MLLKTERLTLTPIHSEDAFEMNQCFDEHVTRYMWPSPAKDLNETHAVIKQFVEQFEQKTDYVFTIRLNETSEFIGCAGIHQLTSSIPELGIWTKVSSHGHYYGREAVGALISFAKEHGYHRLSYPVDSRNIASEKIAQSFGGVTNNNIEQILTRDGRQLELKTYHIDL